MLNIIKNALNYLKSTLYIFDICDIIEIIILTAIMYKIQLWLNKDKLSNLLLYLYGYASFLAFCYFCNLQTLYFLTIHISPLLTILSILMHQETLQKNFITSISSNTDNANILWPTELIKSIMHSINNNQEVWCIIEFNNNLSQIIHCQYYINADISKDLLHIFLPINPSNKLMWLNSYGKIIAINCNIDINAPEDLLNLTSKTDCIILKTDLKLRAFNIIYQGKLLEKVSPQQTIIFLEQKIETILKSKS